MRLHVGSIPESPDFAPGETWTPVREPSPWLMQFIALPIGIAAASVVASLWFVITPLREIKLPGGLSALLPFAGIVVVHELIHAAVHPMAGCSSDSIIGFWPSKLLFYAHYDDELTRNRFIAILLMPLVVISLAPLVVAAIARNTTSWVVLVSCFMRCWLAVISWERASSCGRFQPPRLFATRAGKPFGDSIRQWPLRSKQAAPKGGLFMNP